MTAGEGGGPQAPLFELVVETDDLGRASVRVTAVDGSDPADLYVWVTDRLSNTDGNPDDDDPVRRSVDPYQSELRQRAQQGIVDAWTELQERYGLRTDADVLTAIGAPRSTSPADLRAIFADQALLRVELEDPSVQGFPGFQFGTSGTPLPVMREVLRLRPDGWEDEDLVLWLSAPNGWLRGDRPADYLAARPEMVLRALELAAGASA